MTFCENIRQETAFYFEASFDHPFVRGIAKGDLPLETFAYYIAQDAYYLKHYAKVLALAAAKVTNAEDMPFFLEMARYIHEAELDIHRTTFQTLNIDPQFEAAPAAVNYVNYLYRVVQDGDIAEVMAAILPCPWLYQEIGQRFKYAKPSEPLYQQWLDVYSSDEMATSVANQQQLMDRLATAAPEKAVKLAQHFKRSCFYEWQFWEMAWTAQDWTKEVQLHESR